MLLPYREMIKAYKFIHFKNVKLNNLKSFLKFLTALMRMFNNSTLNRYPYIPGRHVTSSLCWNNNIT